MNRKPIIVPRQPECPYTKSFGYIYMLTNKLNGNRYIGKHVYRYPYKDPLYWASGGEHLQNALSKVNNDKSQFQYEILDWVEYTNHNELVLSKYLSDLEMFYIDLLGTFINPQDYNETPGGDNWKAGELNPMYNNHRWAGENHPLYGKYKENNPNYGKKRSEEFKRRMSESAKANRDWSGKNNPMYGVHLNGPKNPFYGKHHTSETKEKLSKLHKGMGYKITGEKNGMFGRTFDKSPRAVPVVQLTKEGVFVRSYKSISEAVFINEFSSSSISDCCKGRLKTYKGFKWMYLEDYNKLIRKEVVRCLHV